MRILTRAGPGVFEHLLVFLTIYKKRRLGAIPFLVHLLILLSAHVVKKKSDPGHSRSGHQITESDLTSEEV